MYKKCTICYENNKKPSNKDCQYCDDELQRLEAENKLLEEEKRDKIKLLEQIINILYPNSSDNELYDVAFNVEFINKLKEIKAENEELKEEYKQFQHISADEVHRLRKALVEIREDMQEDTTCESRECGCDDYAQCLNCIKETIITKINEVLK